MVHVWETHRQARECKHITVHVQEKDVCVLTIAVDEIASLDHKIFDHTVKLTPFVPA